MKAQDVMTQPVVTVAENASIFDAAGLMLRRRISGLPVVDAAGHLTGMVTEGDFLRRSETGTQRRRPRWIEFLVGPGRLASEYVHTSGRRVNEVMTVDVHTVQRETSLEDVVRLAVWCVRSGRHWHAGVEHLGLFITWLQHAGPQVSGADTAAGGQVLTGPGRPVSRGTGQ